MTEPEENHADAVVLCKDGKYRTFVAAADEVLNYEGHSYTYLLMPEPEGRGNLPRRPRRHPDEDVRGLSDPSDAA